MIVVDLGADVRAGTRVDGGDDILNADGIREVDGR